MTLQEEKTEVELSTMILSIVVSHFSLCLLPAPVCERQISTEESTFSPVHPVPPKPLKPALKRPSVVERPTEIPTSKRNTEHVPNPTLPFVHYSAVHLLCANIDGVVLALNCPPLLSPYLEEAMCCFAFLITSFSSFSICF